MNILDFLNGHNYGVFNRPTARLIGLHTTIILSEIIDKYEYYKKGGLLVHLKDKEGEWFYMTAESIEERTTLTEKEQRPCINKLISLGFIKKEISGIPAKRYFQLDINKIVEFFQPQINSTSLDKRPDWFGQKAKPSLDKRPAIDTNKNHYIEPEEKESAPPPQTPSPSAHEVTLLLFEAIKKTKPDLKQPNLERWEAEMDRMLRIDKRNLETVKRLIEWLPSCSFWSLNILSAEKFREQFDKIELKMNQNASKGPLNDLQLISRLETRKDLIERKIIVLGADYVEFPNIRDAYFKAGEPGFKEKVLNSLRKAGIPVT
jgi:hypothetical protein